MTRVLQDISRTGKKIYTEIDNSGGDSGGNFDSFHDITGLTVDLNTEYLPDREEPSKRVILHSSTDSGTNNISNKPQSNSFIMYRYVQRSFTDTDWRVRDVYYTNEAVYTRDGYYTTFWTWNEWNKQLLTDSTGKILDYISSNQIGSGDNIYIQRSGTDGEFLFGGGTTGIEAYVRVGKNQVLKFTTTGTGAGSYNILHTGNMSKIYPVGSIYMNYGQSVDPATLFGGTWVKLTSRFIYASNSYGGSQSSSTGASASSHTHGSGTTSTNGTLKAPIGAVNNNISAIGYKTADAISGVSYSYAITGSAVSISNVNHAISIYGQVSYTAPSIPYISVGTWYRSA